MFLKTFVLCLVSLVSLTQSFKTTPTLPEIYGDKFYYFGYGSNMLTARIHIQNPTAVKIGVGLLQANYFQDYRLDFNTFTKRWGGAPATIVPTDKAVVYGTLWEIDLSNMDDLDDQEGVHLAIYAPVSVQIVLPNNTIVAARAYVLLEQPSTELTSLAHDKIPLERQPSKTYLQCLVKGALETGIPTSYVRWLQSLKHNGHVAEDLEEVLGLKAVELSS